MIYGYARVSTDGQSVAAQADQLTAAGCDRIFSETASGQKTDRRQLGKLLASLRPGDVVIVTRLDRLARSTRDLLNIVAKIADAGATFRSLGDTWADATTPHGRLLLTMLGGLAEFERDLIRSRTAEGQARAKASGVKFGRKKCLTPLQVAYVAQQRALDVPTRQLAKLLKCSHSTISRIEPKAPTGDQLDLEEAIARSPD